MTNKKDLNPIYGSTLSAGLMGIQELSDFLGLRKATIIRWDGREGFPSAYRIGTRRDRRWARAAILSWLHLSVDPKRTFQS
jgi:predicted DNA-binding transcriptional regulator AlpA